MVAIDTEGAVTGKSTRRTARGRQSTVVASTAPRTRRCGCLQWVARQPSGGEASAWLIHNPNRLRPRPLTGNDQI